LRLDVMATVVIFILSFTLILYHFIRCQYFISSRNVAYFYLKAKEMVNKNSFPSNVYVEKIFLYSFNKTTNYRIKTIGAPYHKYIYSIIIYKIFENGTIIHYRIFFKP